MKKNSFFNLYLDIILLFPIFTLFQTFFSYINQVFVFLLVIVQIFLMSTNKVKIKNWFIIFVTFLLEISALYFTTGTIYNLNTIFYFPFFILFFTLITDYKNKVKLYLIKRINYIHCIIIIWTLLVGISIFLPTSYVTGWGGAKYFGSYTGTIFRLGPTAVFVCSLIILYRLIKKKKGSFLYFLIPLYSFFMGGSRTYLVLGVSLLFIYLYLSLSKKTFLISIIPILFIIVFFIFNSSMADKIESTIGSNYYGGVLGALSNGRTYFWVEDIKAFYGTSLFNRLFGNGFNFVYDVNLKTMNSLIWAHNDFIQLLTTYGYFGLLIYCLTFFNLFKSVKKDIIFTIIIIFIWFFNAMFNMFYTYFCSMLSFPILLLSYEIKNDLGD